MQNKIDALHDLIYVCRKLRERGLVNATHGNISIRVDDTMFITPTGCDLETVQVEDLVGMDIPTQKIVTAGKPSKEWEMHYLGYKQDSETRGIVHAHCPKAVALGSRWGNTDNDTIVPCYTLAFALFTKRLPMVPYFKAGSHELAMAASQKLKHNSSVLLANHGVITTASTVKNAYYRLEEIEENCAIALDIGISGNQALDPDNL